MQVRSFLFGLILPLLFCLPHIFAQPITFTNEVMNVGIQHYYPQVGTTFVGGGVTFCDFDNDGWDDLTFATLSGELLAIYKNEGGETFNNIAANLNISQMLETKTVSWADYDNDGDKDLLISDYFGTARLFQNNQNMDMTEVTATAGIFTINPTLTVFCWADFNNDGWLDLYIGIKNSAVANQLYINNSDGTFTDIAMTAGVEDFGKEPLAIVAFDYDNDGWVDIYIASDRLLGNSMYKNNGDGTFTNTSESSNTDLNYHAMGIGLGDYNTDGFFDMVVSNGPDGNAFLKNNGDGTFTNIADSLGTAVNKICWGANFFDYDNDSDLDFYVAVSLNDSSNANVLFANDGNGSYSQVTGIGMDADTTISFGTAIGDYNNDGYCDIAVLNEDHSPALWKNSGGSNNWIKINLEGTISNRDAIGSIIKAYYDGKASHRVTHCGTSYISQNSTTEHIGLGNASIIDSLEIQWPLGNTQMFYDITVNQTVQVLEDGDLTGINAPVNKITQFDLHKNYPNPFNPSTTITYQLHKKGEVDLSIFNVLGQKVKTLLKTQQSATEHSVEWNGTNEIGSAVSSGIYIYTLKVGGFSKSQKMVLIR